MVDILGLAPFVEVTGFNMKEVAPTHEFLRASVSSS